MFPIRLVQLIESHADKLSEGLMNRLKTSDRRSELLHRVPAEHGKICLPKEDLFPGLLDTIRLCLEELEEALKVTE